MAIEMKKTKLKMNKPIYLGMSILDTSKTLMYEFWYDYMDTDSFIIYIKTEDFYKDIANDVEKWFDTSNYDENDKMPLQIGKNKRVIGLFQDELEGYRIEKIIFVGLRAKTYAYLTDDNTDKKKQKEQKSL